MGSMRTWILFIQMFLISAGAVSLAMRIKFTVPMAVNEAPAIWAIALSWLRPLYLHIVINAIIITIAAASRFHQNQSERPPVQSQQLVSVRTPPPAYFAAFSPQPEVRTIVEVPQPAAAAYDSEERIVELKPVIVNGTEVDSETDEETMANSEDEDAFLDRALTYNTPSPERSSPEFQLEYLLPVKPTGNIHERARESKHDTLDTTWKKIMEKASVSRATREEVRHVTALPPACGRVGRDNVPKSRSFTERPINDELPPRSTSFRIHREISPDQDELKRRVESFIKKVYDEIRSRRQESLNQHR